MMTEPAPMPMCPMANMCKGMMEKPFSGVMLIIPGLMLIALGIVIVLEPRILAWLIAVIFVLFGLMLLMMASFVRKMGKQFRNMRERAP
jgi:uncharacterized membrane protein HdeD (DUF308 family)